MKKFLIIILILTLTNCSFFKKKTSYLFIQSSESATYNGKVLHLNKISKNITFFSDRPRRITGNISNADFVKIWNNTKQKNSFKKDPPNSAIYFLDEKKNLKSAIVENSDLTFHKNSASYEVKILSGKLSRNMRQVVIFIDNTELSTPGVYVNEVGGFSNSVVPD